MLSIEARIKAYWQLSQIWNETPDSQNTTVHGAINTCNDILKYCAYNSKIEKVTYALLDDIIQYGSMDEKRSIQKEVK